MKAITTLLLICSVTLISAQFKQDYYWPFALDKVAEEEGVQAFAFDFNVQPFEPSLRESDLAFDQMNASICDPDGNLLMYTNGCAVANRNHQMMPNGDSINAGRFFDDFWGGNCRRGYPTSQDITILPDPSIDDGFYIIHKPDTYDPDGEIRFSKDSLQFTYVDMNMDEGRGDVTQKNVTFYEGSLVANYLTPIIHSNQKDYWIINPVFPNGFLTYLLDEDGLHEVGVHPGPVWDPRKASSSGYARFSHDGLKYAYFNQYDGLYLYDFNREDATFSNEQHIPGTNPLTGIFATCEWSPNSRFLYMSRADSLWQLDTWAEPIESGRQLIMAKSDPSVPNYLIAALGPDCRIYIRDKGSRETMNIIHKPDELGLACDFQENGVRLPFISSAGSFPNFPVSVSMKKRSATPVLPHSSVRPSGIVAT